MTRNRALGDIGLFLLLLLPMTAAADWLLLAFGAKSTLAIAIIMWTVGAAALAATRLRKRPLAELGWNWGPARFHVIAVLLPVIYGGAAYGLAAAFGLAGFASEASLDAFKASAGFEELGRPSGYVLALALTFLGGLPAGYARALGEEIGWRGFLTPRMNAAFGFGVGTLITGIIWGGWHLPLIVMGPYNANGPAIVEVIAFLIWVAAISAPFAWIRMASGSLWPAATFHAAHNVIIQRIFDPLATRGDQAVTMVGEFGIIFAAVTCAVSVPFWIMGFRMWKRQTGDNPGDLPPQSLHT